VAGGALKLLQRQLDHRLLRCHPTGQGLAERSPPELRRDHQVHHRVRAAMEPGRCSHRGPRGSCVSYSPTLRGGGTSATWRPKRGSVLRRRPSRDGQR
jgi:hypothetical protein